MHRTVSEVSLGASCWSGQGKSHRVKIGLQSYFGLCQQTSLGRSYTPEFGDTRYSVAPGQTAPGAYCAQTSHSKFITRPDRVLETHVCTIRAPRHSVTQLVFVYSLSRCQNQSNTSRFCRNFAQDPLVSPGDTRPSLLRISALRALVDNHQLLAVLALSLSMSGELLWRPLPLAALPGMPVLLVSADIGSATYTVRVTDMANIWMETLDRKAICMRAWSDNTSIDPSDTPENMAKFLATIQLSLDPCLPGHDQTDLTLLSGSSTDNSEHELILKITCPLPGFSPLKWSLHLKKSPPSAIATELVLPLIEAHYTRKQEVESLIQTMKDKDTVIGKLSDKLEAIGTGLENVFTSLLGKKKVTRKSAEGYVKGLSPFEEIRWKSCLMNNSDGPSNASELTQQVFNGHGLQYQSTMQIDGSPELDTWWKNFQSTSRLMHQGQQQVKGRSQRTPSPSTEALNVDDDDFQVQATPPHLKSSKGGAMTRSSQALDDASTDSDVESPPKDTFRRQPPRESSQQDRIHEPKTRMGAIGGRKPALREQSPPPKASISPVSKPVILDDDGDTASCASDDDGDATVSVPENLSPPQSPPLSKPPVQRGRLGRVGGSVLRTQAAEMAQVTESRNTESSSIADALPARTKLGAIGNRIGNGAGSTTVSTLDNASRRGRISEESQSKIQPRESSQERADRRREELKRELEKKTAAGPAKKKRRF